MKKMLTAALALVVILSMSTTALAADITSTESGSNTASQNVTASYTSSSGGDGTVSVDIEWGALSFTYDDEGGWTCADGANKITVSNSGSASVNAAASYEQAAGYTAISGSFENASGETVTSASLSTGNSHDFYLTLSGKPAAEMKGSVIGSVTVTISAGSGSGGSDDSADTVTTVTTADELKTALATGGSIKLGGNITVNEYLRIKADTNLDLNNYTLSITGNIELATADAYLKVSNGTIERTTMGAAIYNEGKNLVINNCTVIGKENYAVSMAGGTAIITNSTLKGGVSIAGGGALEAIEGVTMTQYSTSASYSGVNVADGTATLGFDPTDILSDSNKGDVKYYDSGMWTVTA